ncbi:hypothetical protein [Haliangium ochraceum]|uniref:Uncharacterized protein n=1 Tax=Haliangium ochraceum (strain DSM 14365 / JCM 11303 / SMP-2) TaxID=502025 RepID=D0LUE9_HALO1|nr:hypothetical protein [Haliangium ochraceum]ACY19272.1 hypothetical protein Hoch_6808 [Haliangium ochraceum DSM 14365]
MADDRNSESPADNHAPTTPETAASNADADANADEHPGRPRGRDELDPELLSLAPKRLNIGPLLALSVVVFSLYIMVRLAADLGFWTQGDEPVVYESPAALLAAEDLDNSFAQLAAVPDRVYALRVDHQAESVSGNRLAPVQGTDERLWLLLEGSVWSAHVRNDEVYAGRVRELAEMPFAEPLRAHLRESPRPRFATPEAARAALESADTRLRDAAGDALEVAADTPVRVFHTAPGRVLIETIASERLPDAATWAGELAALGLLAADAEPISSEERVWVFETTTTGEVAAVETALLDARLLAASARPLETIHETTWGALSSAGGTLRFGEHALPWEQLTWLAPTVTRGLPDDAVVLLAGEVPAVYWYVPLLFGLLALSALLFAWALVRALRESPSSDGETDPASKHAPADAAAA